MNLTMGSLFDGSGGFPLAGSLCGIEPRWASEVEPYPIAVTRSRFPNMKHLGDISKINGANIEAVDIITFGSPCQDLSVAGKRAGLKHESNGDEETTRSGLFMEAVRIIKEMRRATNGKYPRFALWENVPGAFSSNKGEDFRIVLEELIKIVEPTASMPPVPSNGWAYADGYIGDGWSLAYRVFDAQYWGVPQRRRRIHLVADFGGECAREILFERNGLRGYFAESGTPRQETPSDAERSIGANDREGENLKAHGFPLGFRPENVRVYDETATTLCNGTRPGFTTGVIIEKSTCHAVPYTLKVRSGVEVDSKGKAAGKGALIQTDKAATLATTNDQYLFQPLTYDARGNGDGDKASTITGDHNNRITDYTSVVIEPFCKSARARSPEDATTWKQGKVANTLNTFDMSEARANELVVEGVDLYNQELTGSVSKTMTAIRSDADHVPCALVEKPVAYGLDRASFNQGRNAQFDFSVVEEQQPTMTAKGPGAVCVRYIVRRLTPTECARLQGFADRWGDIDKKETLTDEEYAFWLEVRNTHAAINDKKVQNYNQQQMLNWYNKLHTDSAEYKMWGNGIALPPALYCMQGIEEVLRREYVPTQKDPHKQAQDILNWLDGLE